MLRNENAIALSRSLTIGLKKFPDPTMIPVGWGACARTTRTERMIPISPKSFFIRTITYRWASRGEALTSSTLVE